MKKSSNGSSIKHKEDPNYSIIIDDDTKSEPIITSIRYKYDQSHKVSISDNITFNKENQSFQFNNSTIDIVTSQIQLTNVNATMDDNGNVNFNSVELLYTHSELKIA